MAAVQVFSPFTSSQGAPGCSLCRSDHACQTLQSVRHPLTLSQQRLARTMMLSASSEVHTPSGGRLLCTTLNREYWAGNQKICAIREQIEAVQRHIATWLSAPAWAHWTLLSQQRLEMTM
eukprot:877083-Rhodomonas_salina.1